MWKDVSCWNRSDTDATRANPRSWELDLPPYLPRIVVTRSIHYAPTDWVVRVLNTEEVLSGDKTADEAKEYAVRLLRAKLAAVARVLGGGE